MASMHELIKVKTVAGQSVFAILRRATRADQKFSLGDTTGPPPLGASLRLWFSLIRTLPLPTNIYIYLF